MSDPFSGPPTGTCRVCRRRPAGVWWTGESGVFGAVHGMAEACCQICVLEMQLKHAREMAQRIQGMEQQLTGLLAEAGVPAAAVDKEAAGPVRIRLPNGDGDDWGDAYVGLVVPAKTGVVWFAQAGAEYCHQMSAEGLFVPLPPYMGLQKVFCGSWGIQQPLPLEEGWRVLRGARDVEEDKNLRTITSGILRLATPAEAEAACEDALYCEAWVPVVPCATKGIVQGALVALERLLAPFVGRVCYLTYPNSD